MTNISLFLRTQFYRIVSCFYSRLKGLSNNLSRGEEERKKVFAAKVETVSILPTSYDQLFRTKRVIGVVLYYPKFRFIVFGNSQNVGEIDCWRTIGRVLRWTEVIFFSVLFLSSISDSFKWISIS